jgi:hypothetical protein
MEQSEFLVDHDPVAHQPIRLSFCVNNFLLPGTYLFRLSYCTQDLQIDSGSSLDSVVGF